MYGKKHKNNPSITSPEIARQKSVKKNRKNIHNSKSIENFAKII